MCWRERFVLALWAPSEFMQYRRTVRDDALLFRRLYYL